MRKILFLLISLFVISINAQNVPNSKKFTEKSYYQMLKIAYSTTSGSTKFIEAKDVPIFLIDSISSTSHKELIPYKDFIKESFDKMCNIRFSRYSYIPELIKYKGLDCVIFKNVISGNVYNSVKLNDKERAVSVFNDIASNTINSIGKCSNKTPQYIGISIHYSSKDFTKDYVIGNGESLTMIVPFKIAKDFYNLEISEDNLIEKSDIILYKLGGTLRKVELHL